MVFYVNIDVVMFFSKENNVQALHMRKFAYKMLSEAVVLSSKERFPLLRG